MKEQEKLIADKQEVQKEKEELLSKRDPKAYATRKKTTLGWCIRCKS